MILDLVDVLRNAYGASGGAVDPSAAAAALHALLWDAAWDAGANAWSDTMRETGGDEAAATRAQHEAFWTTMGWTEAEFYAYAEQYSGHTDSESARHFDESWDVFTEFVRRRQGGGG